MEARIIDDNKKESLDCCPGGPSDCCEDKPAECCSAGPAEETVSTKLDFADVCGAWKARWGIGRMNYTVEPGLYSVGEPDENSPVLVSANYKMTFDTLRKNLTGLDCRILILDTKGVNVWCASGEGTFGTDELIDRIEATGLAGIVSHRQLILPQLGASGVCAYEVKRRTGFSPVFGPVRADDIKAFIAAGCKATREMRTVKFTFRDRLVLAPIELKEAAKISLAVFGVMFLINLLATRPFGLWDLLVYIAAVLVGAVLTPILLPFIPGKAFSFKGWLLGAIVTALILWALGWFAAPFILLGIGYMLALPALSAFLTMNFTGASTYTSPSGVLKEMKTAVPLIVIAIAAGIVLILIKTFAG